ncbi:MAG: glycosyltransferase family 4 protein [candidate division KSB1 bacterium]|nr:glycosyltransferase family 4 protein [candidate division KSB1 bacterium]MDZ7273239.1 glycosyltransferase family 4 protein [candidate division KSB1 bacterium]MDZ7285341.1 glycosyltransferase family 4 protein [candidate division KSB1 bacterium]MDZ7298373.1 glycosyltransferase family 4 protein [candidate division KSB1 bacterium]MDZ7306451.1 glycosyltransferase family 4 protein [candidate division KSB1 bacterium]
MKGLRTAIVTGQYPPQVGGVGHSAHRVANLLADHGLEVHVIALHKHAEPLPFDESFRSVQEGNVQVHRVKVFHPGFDNSLGLSEADVLTRYNREMFDAVDYFQRRHRFDVLHGFFLYPAAFIATLVGRMHRVKTIASIRGNDIGKYAFDPLRMPFVRQTLEQADYVTSVATSLLELADRGLTPVAHKAKVILNSINLAPGDLPPQPALELKGMVIGTAGLFRYKKGLVYLFKALADLRDKVDFSLLLVGDYFSPDDRELHERYLREYDLLARTVITGKIPHHHMPGYLQCFDIVVFPSLFSEGCPLSMIEAMAMGKAVIGSRAGAIPEIIHDHQNGILVSPGSSSQIVEALQELMADAALRRRLGENARASVAHMRTEHELEEWLRVYRHVLMVKV